MHPHVNNHRDVYSLWAYNNTHIIRLPVCTYNTTHGLVKVVHAPCNVLFIFHPLKVYYVYPGHNLVLV